MKEDEISVKSSKFAEVPKVPAEITHHVETPYYWSWYRCIFARHEAGPGARPGVEPEQDI